jgi:DNA invertase Pin-like site-specific DNA recombinase
MESGVDFVAADMPEANRLTMHIIAAVAEYEREMISKRTQAALASAKVRGIRLGNPNPAQAAQKARSVRQAHVAAFHATVKPLVQTLHAEGKTLARIAEDLNTRNIATLNGGRWYATSVSNLLKRATA